MAASPETKLTIRMPAYSPPVPIRAPRKAEFAPPVGAADPDGEEPVAAPLLAVGPVPEEPGSAETGGAVPMAPEESEARAIPFEMLDVVAQLEELGVENGALGVTVSPTVYGTPLITPVKNCAKVEN